jgi:Lrp/AsnC family leucine-responsive transcriptional regulator
MIDPTDIEIIKLLESNCKTQLQEIGAMVHLTGQAVKNRIIRLEKLGIIEGYSAKINSEKLGRKITAYVTVYMKSNDHPAFQKFAGDNICISEVYRISGDGCYLLKISAADQNELTELLDNILKYGNYKVNLSIGKLK